MSNIQKRIVNEFGDKLRVRVCGICIKDDRILLVNHHSLNANDSFWAPPGGGMEFGSSAEENLRREFLEETGLQVEIEKFLFVHEYLAPPLHAIELIYEVRVIGGTLFTGHDPEMKKDEQIIKDVRYISKNEIQKMNKDSIHQMFLNVKDVAQIVGMSGYYRFIGG